MYIVDTKKYQICKCITFLPTYCTIHKIQLWDYTIQIADELLIKIIKLNKGKAKEQSKHLQALEQLRKIKATLNAVITRVITSTAPITPTESHSTTNKDTAKITPKIHQCHTHSHTPIMPTEPPSTPIMQPHDPPCLKHNIIIQIDEDNHMAIKFIQLKYDTIIHCS